MYYYLAWKDSKDTHKRDFTIYDSKYAVFEDKDYLPDMTDLFVLQKSKYMSLKEVLKHVKHVKDLNTLMGRLQEQGMTLEKTVDIASFMQEKKRLHQIKRGFKNCKERNTGMYYLDQADKGLQSVENMLKKTENNFVKELMYIFYS